MSFAPATARPRLPLTVIGGFLGAGKTTLLNRLLRESQGRRLAVLVNDFGALNIDAELVTSSTSQTLALSNGCVCCSIGDDLTRALIGVLESPEPFDAVVIEASGVSDPWRIAQVGLADPGLSLDGVVVLLDASAYLAHAANPLLADSLERQIEAADLIVVNKIDLVDDIERQRLLDRLDLIAGGTPRFETTRGEVPMPLLSGGVLLPDERRPDPDAGRPEPDSASDSLGARAAGSETRHEHRSEHEHHAGHALSNDHGELFDTWSIQPEAEFSAKTLRRLLRQMPAGVLRLKGIVRTDELGWAELQFAGRHGSLRKALAVPAAGAAVVAIGLRHRLPRQALNTALEAARVSGLA